ncbi:trypsin-like peptidase domain-containing protein [candidate division WOR-3 bacterium]|nr:trypsin-like peptidase domain-containing protein [candidate division WOR-3 bacterium]
MINRLLKTMVFFIGIFSLNACAQTPQERELNWLSQWKSSIVMLGDIGKRENGQKVFMTKGTGFLVYNYAEHGRCPFLVTARHIFEHRKTIRIRFSGATSKSLTEDFGYKLNLIDKRDHPKWKGHPSHTDNNVIDVAAIRLDFPVREDIKPLSIPYSYFMFTDSIYESDAVMCLGYPGNVGNLEEIYLTQPILRSGIVSWLSSSQSETPTDFLIDISTYGGNSGGPVFLAPTMSRPISPNVVKITETKCVGLVSRFVPELTLSHDARVMLILQVGQNSGLTEVVPTEMIIETLRLLGNPEKIRQLLK